MDRGLGHESVNNIHMRENRNLDAQYLQISAMPCQKEGLS